MEKLRLRDSVICPSSGSSCEWQNQIQSQNCLTPKPQPFSRGSGHSLGFSYSILGECLSQAHPHLIKSYPSFKIHFHPNPFDSNNILADIHQVLIMSKALWWVIYMHSLIESSLHPYEMGTIIILIWQVRKLRPQEEEEFAFSALPSMWLLSPSSMPLSLL